jgi:hypothetical protein
MSDANAYATVIATLNSRITELRDASASGTSVRRDVIDTERWMRECYESVEYASIRNLIEPFRFRVAVTASVSFYQNWRHYDSNRDKISVDMLPYSEIKTAFDPWRKDAIHVRWREAGGSTVGRERRMIASKSCGVWVAFSLFGLPYPPFDQYLDMDVTDINREEACSLGLMCMDDDITLPTEEIAPAALEIDSDVVTLIAEANRLTPIRVSPT